MTKGPQVFAVPGGQPKDDDLTLALAQANHAEAAPFRPNARAQCGLDTGQKVTGGATLLANQRTTAKALIGSARISVWRLPRRLRRHFQSDRHMWKTALGLNIGFSGQTGRA